MANNKKGKKNQNPMANSRTMAKEGMKIIRDIAYGNFNIYNSGHIFRNLDFVMATLAEVDKRIFEAGLHVTAIEYAYYGTQNQNVLSVLLRDKKTLEAYNIIRENLCAIISTNGDTGFLYVLANKLPKYKYNI